MRPRLRPDGKPRQLPVACKGFLGPAPAPVSGMKVANDQYPTRLGSPQGMRGAPVEALRIPHSSIARNKRFGFFLKISVGRLRGMRRSSPSRFQGFLGTLIDQRPKRGVG
ncbi:MAG: hypothetical protein CM1200mP36_07750 [Gammaproteobacteria bacterium]|nr:MAG: hypothetical protein CM1200mP36_07750 [Gammaproteobacteria bacterium]